MLQTIEAVIDIGGQIRLLEPIKLTKAKRALVTLLNNEDEPSIESEETLRKDWNKPEEDKAWSHLQ
ncbi:hypothetical protein PN36_19180 [Candidatus Thiomargarita nelsonii]|uniref:DUF2281 domain-containing protein n=1 Tax=Candidatus Thiomargarita nelsonii TaxID=1003181 RepID=A0A0A6PLW3_9GAMM|nr:hypothetical protein PN36_19180 [Candidatus Thiomargarita nelsonii]